MKGLKVLIVLFFTNYNEFKCPKLRQISIKTAIYLHISLFFVTSRAPTSFASSRAHLEITASQCSPYCSVARTFLKNMASPFEYATHYSLSQASFYRECEFHIQ